MEILVPPFPRPLLLFLAGGSTITGVAIALKPTEIHTSTALLGLAIVWIGLLPSVLHLSKPSHERLPCPLFAFTGVFYAALFGFPTFLTEGIRSPANGKIQFFGGHFIDAVQPEAQILVLAGLGCLWIGYHGIRAMIGVRLPRFRLPDISYAVPPSFPLRVQILLWALGIAHIIYLAVPQFHAWPSLGQLLKPAGLLVFAGFYVLWHRRQLPRWQAFVVFGIGLPIELLLLLKTGFLFGIAMIAVLYVVLRTWLHGRPPWLFMIAVPILLTLAYPVGGSGFRQIVWHTQPNISPIEAAKEYGHVLVNFYRGRLNRLISKDAPGTEPDREPTVYASAIRRISHINLMSYVVERTPLEIPYWQGETYKPLLTSWIPRIVWSDKPREIAGYSFAVRYGLIEPHETWQSVNLPWIVEMYINFGRTGVLVSMALVGILTMFLERFFSRPDMTPIEAVIGMAIILPLFFQESNFSLMVGSLLPLTVALWLYFAIGLRIPLPAFIQTWRKKWRR